MRRAAIPAGGLAVLLAVVAVTILAPATGSRGWSAAAAKKGWACRNGRSVRQQSCAGRG